MEPIVNSKVKIQKEVSMKFKDMIPPSTSRVKLHTKREDNEKIEQKTQQHIKEYQGASKELLNKRLKQLDREWDTERVLEANAATLILFSTILGFTKRKCWFFLSGIVSFFLLFHAIQGWCPPLPIIRCLGIRTPEEIQEEKAVIKSYIENDHGQKSTTMNA